MSVIVCAMHVLKKTIVFQKENKANIFLIIYSFLSIWKGISSITE